MKGRRPVWAAALAIMVFTLLLAAVSVGFSSQHLTWPAWLTASAGAVLTLALPLGKRPVEMLSDWLAGPLEQSKRRKDALASLPGYHERIEQVTSRLALNIHPAIPLPDDADSDLSDEFPEYIPRDVDAKLRSWIRGHAGTGGLVLLVGPAAAGKTRCLYEALREELPAWRMLQPQTGLEANEVVRAKANLTQSVLWLNELQIFFAADSLTTATVTQLLAGTCGPVLLAGTIRPEELTRVTDQNMGEDKEGVNRYAREILNMIAWPPGRISGAERTVRFDLSNKFTVDEIGRTKALAARDPRLRTALAGADKNNITSTLAGADKLINYWTAGGGDRYGQAIITAAVTARLCGHPDPVTEEALQVLAITRLSASGWAPAGHDWAEQAIAWAEKPVIGEVSAIRAVRSRVGLLDGYKVSDILLQYTYDRNVPDVAAALADIAAAFAEDKTWQELIDRATPAVNTEIGVTAQHRGKHSIAERAWRKSSDQGDTRAMLNLGWLLRQQNRHNEALTWFRKAANLGYVPAMTSLGFSLGKSADSSLEGEQWSREAAISGDLTAMVNLGFVLQGRGARTEAKEWYRKAADLGSELAMSNMAFLLEQEGDLTGAESWYRRAVDRGAIGAASNLANILERQGNPDEAMKMHREAAERSYKYLTSNPLDFRPWPGEASDLGVSHSMLNFATRLSNLGQFAEAVKWYRRGVELGDARAAAGLAGLLEKASDFPAAQEWRLKAGDLAQEWRLKAGDLAYTHLTANSYSLIVAYGKSAKDPYLAIMRDCADLARDADQPDAAEEWDRKIAEHTYDQE